MTSGKLPVPKAAGPIAGQPGHFAHHDWVEGSLNVLDERLIKMFAAVTITTPLPPSADAVVKYDTVMFDTGLDVNIDSTVGGVVFGPAAPEGYYRIDYGLGIQQSAGSARRAKLFLNGVNNQQFYINVRATTSTGGASGISTSGILYCPALAVVQIKAWQDDTATVQTQTASQCRLYFEYLGVGPTQAEGGSAPDDALTEADIEDREARVPPEEQPEAL